MKAWEIELKAVNRRSKYYGVGPIVMVIEVQSTQGPRFTCLTDRTRTCEHCDAVRQHLNAPYV